MKHILYISHLKLDKKSGVSKKVISQIKALRKLGMKVSYIGVNEGKIYYFNEEDQPTFIENSSDNSIIREMKLIKNNIKIIKELGNINFIYIRYLFSTPQMIKLLKCAKKRNIKIVEEIPTYPYDEEMKNSKRLALKLALIVDKLYRKKLRKYLCNIVTFSEDDSIYGTKTIKIDNGIDVDSITPIDIKYSDNTINMIAVSSMEYWQGYDRAIKSLKNYYDTKSENEPDIVMHLAGDGTELEALKELTKKLELDNNVVFYGFLSGKELDDIYDKCQCAIAGLGIFRKNITDCKTLKIREYVAKAIPFVYSTNDKGIANFKYAYKVSDDEEIFDMHLVIKFLDELNKDSIKKEMRNFAEQNYRWELQMKKVLDTVFADGENNVNRDKEKSEQHEKRRDN